MLINISKDQISLLKSTSNLTDDFEFFYSNFPLYQNYIEHKYLKFKYFSSSWI